MCERDSYTFDFAGTPAEFVALFRQYYGPTMNAFAAAAKDGRAEELERELVTLFEAQNHSKTEGETSISATFLRVTVTV